MNGRNFVFLVICVLAIYFRFAALTPESLYFADEGAMIAGSRALFSLPGAVFTTLMAKPSFETLIGFVLWLGGNKIIVAQWVNACFGLMWIALFYFIARNATGKQTLAIIVLCLAAVDPWIVLYSRKLNADAFACFFWYFSLLLLVAPSQKTTRMILSGLLIGISFTANYRLLMFLPLTVLFYGWNASNAWKEKIRHSLIYILSSGIAPILFLLFYHPLRGDEPNGYLRQLVFQYQFNTFEVMTFRNLLVYPTILLQQNGILMLFFMALGSLSILLSGFKNTLFKLFVLFYLLPQIWFSMMVSAHARIWTPLLFWNSMLAGLGICFLADRMGKQASVFALLLIVCLIPKANDIKNIRLPYYEIIQYIGQREKTENVPFAATNQTIVYGLTDHHRVEPILDREGLKALKSFQDRGYYYLLLDPYRFANPMQSLSQTPRTISRYLLDHCVPLQSFPCQSPKAFWTHLAWENNYAYQETQSFLKNRDIEHLNCIELFDLRTCNE